MGLGLGGLDQQRSEINVTPLIDVLLVLLVIFMIITPLLTKALHSDIPQKSDAPLPQEYAAMQLVLTITADGRTLLNSDEVGLTQLPDRLRQVFEQRGHGRTIFVNAENGVPYGVVVHAMDLCWTAGAEQVGIVTDPIEQTQRTAPAPAP